MRDADFAGRGRGFFVRCGSRILPEFLGKKARGARLFGDSDGQSKASREAAITAVPPKKAPDSGLGVKRQWRLSRLCS